MTMCGLSAKKVAVVEKWPLWEGDILGRLSSQGYIVWKMKAPPQRPGERRA